jgi:hypothetical protein
MADIDPSAKKPSESGAPAPTSDKTAEPGEPAPTSDKTAEPGEPKPPLDGVLRIYPPTDGEHAARLAECSAAFARGNFGGARRLAGEVTSGKPTDAERLFASEILRRTAIDPVALGIGVGCFILFWVVIWLTVWR